MSDQLYMVKRLTELSGYGSLERVSAEKFNLLPRASTTFIIKYLKYSGFHREI